ncbi:hypothetical protein ACN27F_23305 [Solwaraspora sp. WMMB335]|uniref:hypothetical protein n=1 Tax=Solwaraspora sp. WMMB335 TaxID=3404118 RepID=UPI003B92E224
MEDSWSAPVRRTAGYRHVATPAFAVGVGAALLLLVVDELTIPQAAALRTAAAGGVLLLGVLARTAISLGGVATADFVVRRGGTSAATELAARVHVSGMRLAGLVLGVTTLAAGSALWLATRAGVADRLVAVTVGACLTLRSPLFGKTWAAMTTAAGGGLVMLVAGYHLAVGPPGLVQLAPIAAALVCGVFLLIAESPALGAGFGGRLLRLLESTAVIAMMCAVAAAYGLLDAAVD